MYPYDIDCVRQSIRGTYFCLKNALCGMDGVNPHIMAYLFQTCIFPRALFACELWNYISKSDMQKLESTLHLCLKNVQGFPYRTRSDMVKGMLGFTSIEAYIDKQKLMFLQMISNLESCELSNRIFLTRLMHFKFKITKDSFGFIPDVMNILRKYHLDSFIDTFVESGSLPHKLAWKRIVKSTILTHEQTQWQRRMIISVDFIRFRTIHSELRMSNLWSVAKEKSDSVPLIRFVANLLCANFSRTEIECCKCHNMCIDEFEHLMFNCRINNESGKSLNVLIDKLEPTFGNEICDLLRNCSHELIMMYCLGYVDHRLSCIVESDQYSSFLVVCARHVSQIYK